MDDVFARLPAARRYWAVASVHGEADRLSALQDAIEERFESGDQLIYLGNLIGQGGAVRATLDAVLGFRRRLLARSGVKAGDITLLRGAQEEMWHKLLQIQLAPDPENVLAWMQDQGVQATAGAYRGDLAEGLKAARTGKVELALWVDSLRAAHAEAAGHADLLGAVSQAAYTEDGQLLFVNAGIDPDRPLFQQADTFWWGGRDFEFIDKRYFGARRVVRGFDHRHRGLVSKDATLSIDAGCGFGGKLLCACLDGTGALIEALEV
ncbi:MAG: hypothetical protein ACPGOV_00905 [Magnetovibrionaceae bacterium]